MHRYDVRPETQRGLSLIEMMVAITVGLLLIAGLAITFANSSQSYSELQKLSQQIENGGYALTVMRDDLQHAGFFGAATKLPATPGTAPDPCDVSLGALATAVALPIQGYDSPSTSPITACIPDADHVANTDIVVVRRADPALLTAAPIANELYVQASAAGIEVQSGNPTGFVLPSVNSDNTVAAVGTKATGGQAPVVMKMMNAAGAAPLNTIARVAADIRKLHVHVYFVAPCSRPATGQTSCTAAADGGTPIPTLKRLELGVTAGGAAAMQVRTIAEGIENLQVEYGFDMTPAAVSLTTGLPGDGVIDTYATDVPGGAFTQWTNVMAVRLYVLARNPTATPGFNDEKTYTLGLAGTYTPTATSFRRHLFAGEVRLINLSSRREEPK